MSYSATWSDPNNHQTNLESGDVLYAATVRQAWMQVFQWLGTQHVHKGRDGDGPLWPITPIQDFKTLAFYNPVSWNGPGPSDEDAQSTMMEADILDNP